MLNPMVRSIVAAAEEEEAEHLQEPPEPCRSNGTSRKPKKDTLATMLLKGVEQLTTMTLLSCRRRRLEPGPPQRWELREGAWRICKGSVVLMRTLIRLRSAGLSRDELLLALENVRMALEAQR
jgi:hypothetical protein